MIVLRARNVHEALRLALIEILKVGVKRSSRNGDVLQFPEPVTTIYEKPNERVLFWAQRDANPFLHFAESLWMLAGRRDLAFMSFFAKSFEAFSDDGSILGGAYGYRWRKYFGSDQLISVVEALRANKNDRRAVLQMWDGREDHRFQNEKKDVPCNTAAYFSIDPISGDLDMLVSNRSNDMIWGAYGANAVHFSYLQEFIACALSVGVGRYRQVSNNLHLYINSLSERVVPIADLPEEQPYAELEGCTPRLFTQLDSGGYTEFLNQCEHFVSDVGGATAPGMHWFFRRVALPIFQAHSLYKMENQGNTLQRIDAAREYVGLCKDPAWAQACDEWLLRRKQSAILKQSAPKAGGETEKG